MPDTSQPQLPLHIPEASYFTRRMATLGILPEMNVIQLWQSTKFGEEGNGENVLKPFPVFEETERGIDILVYGLGRQLIRFSSEGSRHKNHIYKISRLEVPYVNKEGKEAKYLMPKGQATQPFFPPALVAHYDKCVAWKGKNPGKALPEKLKLHTLFMTEGYFKAFKAGMHGLHVVGLSSINHMKNKETGALHEDIYTLLVTCEVDRFVWLTDGDCRNISTKEITDTKDLYTRPWGFFKTISTFADLLSKLPDVRLYFAHIPSEEITGNPKGIDDLLCELPGEVKEIVAEYHDFSQKETKGTYDGKYIFRKEISYGLSPVRNYFMLNNVDDFYTFHVQKRKELATKAFKFNGSLYKFNEEQAKCLVEIPGAAERYFRVGDNYYEWIEVPNKFGETVRTYKPRQKTTITDDHGKGILKHIVRYHDFCIVPDHLNYQPIIHNCFNKYIPLPHVPEKGECPTSMAFVKHIFGESPVTVDNGDGLPQIVPYYELGLDYITILLRYPQQVLPILCLVSKENNTGKSTFLDWLNFIFIENMIQVGNEDLANEFNAYWASKLIVACDETKIDKVHVFEKVKRLSTGGSNVSQGKGTNQEVVDNFVKFIFCSNNEDNLVNITARDTRFWINKVNPFGTTNVSMRAELKEEIEAFLYFIYNRQMVTKNMERHWFDTKLLKTEALRRLIENTKPSMERRIRMEIADLFDMQPGCDQFYMTLEGLSTDILKKADKNYVKRTLNDMGYEALTTTTRGKYPRRIEVSIPITGTNGSNIAIQIKYIDFIGKPYLFKRTDFTDHTDPASIGDDDSNKLPF